MIQLTLHTPRGAVLGLGLSFGNLERLEAGQPAFTTFEPARARFVLASAREHRDLALAMVQHPGDHVVGLTARTVAALRAGEAVELEVSQLGLHRLVSLLIFAGPTEFEMIEALRASGFVDAATRLEGLEEYLRHERNEVETCEFCRERRHYRRRPPVATQPPGTWRDRLYAHPYLASLGLLSLFALIGAAVSLLRG